MEGYEKTYAECRVEFPNDLVAERTAADCSGLQPPLVGIDLEPMQAIMVSTGDNLNDDVFLPDETEKAIASIPHKPVNDSHKDKEIRGHIIAATRLDKPAVNGQPSFDVAAASVLYKLIYPEFVAELKSKIAAKKAFVSMEAYFSNYDYKVGDKIIQRNSATAFLDKILRVKGGTGVFDGVKVKRVLRNIIFGGMGIVDNPANPESVVLASQVQSGTQSTEVKIDMQNLWTKINENCVKYNDERILASAGKGDIVMSATATKEEEVKAEPAKAADAPPAPEAKPCPDCGKPMADCSCEAKKKCAEVEAKNIELTDKLAEANKSIETLKASVATLSETTKTAEAKINELSAVIASAKTAELLAKRSVDFAVFDISAEDLPEINESLKTLDDAAYAKYLAKANRLFKQKVVVAAVVPPVKTEEVKAAEATAKIETAVANKETGPIKGSEVINNSKATASRLAEALFKTTKESK